MQIPTSAGMLTNSVLPVTPTQGGLLPQAGETARSSSFAPVEAVSDTYFARVIPGQSTQSSEMSKDSGRVDAFVRGDEGRISEEAKAHRPEGDDSDPIQENPSHISDSESKQQVRNQEKQQQQDLEFVRSLSQRDSEVHAHEGAHSAVGGRYAGSANYTYQRGPDGVNYAVGGEVSIDVGVIPGNPAATLEKMQLVQRAALAPAEPSSQDRKVAALAAQQAGQARAELANENRGSSSSETSSTEKADKLKDLSPSVRSDAESQSDTSSKDFQFANDRISKINEILVAISQNEITSATGQLLDDVV